MRTCRVGSRACGAMGMNGGGGGGGRGAFDLLMQAVGRQSDKAATEHVVANLALSIQM